MEHPQGLPGAESAGLTFPRFRIITSTTSTVEVSAAGLFSATIIIYSGASGACAAVVLSGDELDRAAAAFAEMAARSRNNARRLEVERQRCMP
jgi:hypothetical protein